MASHLKLRLHQFAYAGCQVGTHPQGHVPTWCVTKMQSEAPANETMSDDAAKVALCVDLKVADEEEPVAYYEVNAARRRTWMCGTEGSSGGFEALPEPLLEQIAGLSSLGSVLACRLVCKRWNYHFSCACKVQNIFKTVCQSCNDYYLVVVGPIYSTSSHGALNACNVGKFLEAK